MNIENEIFKRSVILYDKLLSYGFKKVDGRYVISKEIMDGTFKAEITISENGEVEGKVFDLSFGEEYTNYRIKDQLGEFANKVKDEFSSMLLDIRDNCTSTKYFITNQANRITNTIIEKYGDKPEFAWEKSPGFGIFRNPKNEKWYGLLMNIDRSKLDNQKGEVEILNVKLDKDKITDLLKREGYYLAYHMNKKNWITILLDNTIKDDEILGCIEESHRFTESGK